MTFDLRKNNFFILGISPRDRIDLVSERIEILLSDGELSEELASKIQRDLSGSKTRLASEISWLLEVSPNRASQIVAQFLISTDAPLSDLIKVVDEVEPLSSTNLAAHFCSTRIGVPEIVNLLVNSWNDLSVENVCNLVNENRQVSAFPSLPGDLVKDALLELKQNHSEAALKCIVGCDHPGVALTQIVEDQIKIKKSISPFLESIIEKYEGYVIPKLKAYEDDISSSFDIIRNAQYASDYKVKLDGVLSTLKNWDEFSQPLQLVHQSKGLDEPRAKRVFEQVRDIPLWLANEKSEYALSLEFTKSLTEIFPELPSSIVKLESDIETLTELVEESKANEDLAPIIKILQEVLEDAVPLNESITKGEFADSRGGVAGNLFKTIVSVRQEIQNKPHEEEMWDILREIGIFLYDKHSWIQSAISLNKGLLGLNPPPQVQSLIAADILTLERIERNIIGKQFVNAAKNQQIAKARDIAKQLVETATEADDKKEWEEVYATLVAKRKSQLRGMKIWGVVIVGFILLIIISDNTKKSKPTASSNYNLNQQNQNKYSNSALAATEIKPVIGTKVVSIAGLRWCTFERELLDFVTDHFPQNQYESDPIRKFNGTILSQSMIDEFDARISDYNSRCNDVQYYEKDLSTVQFELNAGRTNRVNEAKQLMRGWSSRFRFKE